MNANAAWNLTISQYFNRLLESRLLAEFEHQSPDIEESDAEALGVEARLLRRIQENGTRNDYVVLFECKAYLVN